MKGNWKWASGAVLAAVIALGMIAPGLAAWPAPTTGEFKLPFNAKWGVVALPTGDYTFQVNSFSAQGIIVIYRGNRSVAAMHPEFFDGREVAPGTNLELLGIRHDGKFTVRALRTNGGTFYFSLPKDLKLLLAQQPQLIETVPVQLGE